MKIIEITKVFTMNKYPKKLLKDDGIDIYSDEYLIACLLVEKFGGTLKVLKANQKTEHIKYADYLWNGKLWELKQASSINAIDTRIRKGIKQIIYNPGGIVINIIDNKLHHTSILKKVRNRIFITKKIKFKVIVIENNKITVFLKK